MFYLGTIPAPILFGAIIDRSCLSWQKTCEHDKGSCFVYDNWMMATYLLAVIFCFKSLSICFFSLAILLYRAPPTVAAKSAVLAAADCREGASVGSQSTLQTTEVSSSIRLYEIPAPVRANTK